MKQAALRCALAAWACAAAAQGGVRYEARLDDKDRAFVDVFNGGSAAIRVTSLSVEFKDRRGETLQRRTLDCEHDCSVAPQAKESFGPIDGPRGWETVEASEVLYRALESRPLPEPTAPSRAPEPRTSAPPRQGVAAALDWSSPEAVVRAFYVALNRGDSARARELCSRSANEAWSSAPGGDAFPAFVKSETRDATVTEVRLLAPAAAGSATIVVGFAEGKPAKRRILFKREGPGLKIDRVEPLP